MTLVAFPSIAVWTLISARKQNKYKRIKMIKSTIHLTIGVDNAYQVNDIHDLASVNKEKANPHKWLSNFNLHFT